MAHELAMAPRRGNSPDAGNVATNEGIMPYTYTFNEMTRENASSTMKLALLRAVEASTPSSSYEALSSASGS